MKRKNYLRMFLALCIKHDIWFAIYGDGTVDECTDTSDMDRMSFAPKQGIKLGSKAAYEWLVQAYKENE